MGEMTSETAIKDVGKTRRADDGNELFVGGKDRRLRLFLLRCSGMASDLIIRGANTPQT